MYKHIFDIQRFGVTPTLSNTHNYTPTDLDDKVNFGALLEVRFNKIFFETYEEIPEQFSKVFNVQTSSKAEEKDWGMGAFTDWEKRTSQVDEVDYKTLSPGLERRYVHEAFTQGFMITREMYDDDQYRQMDKMPAAMARSGRAKVEKDPLAVFNKGFSALPADAIYDGQPLFSNAHPLLDSTKLGKNLITGPLNQENLTKAIQLMRETVDEAGNLIQLTPNRLIIPPALHETAVRLLGSDRIAGTELNDTNAFLRDHGIEIVVLDYLGAHAGGSDTAWFIQDKSRHELNFFWRKRPEFAWDEDFDTYVSKYRGYMRYSFGVSDWRGIIGSEGA